jgi:hypothetical protein
MSFRITGLDPAPFQRYFAMNDDELAAVGALRRTVDKDPGFPCRVSLEDGAIGDEVLLIRYDHHAVASPYRGSGPIFVRRAASRAFDGTDSVPPVVARRLVSVRAYDAAAMMVGADVCRGSELPALIERLFADPAAAYLHVHNAKAGCFSCRVERA